MSIVADRALLRITDLHTIIINFQCLHCSSSCVCVLFVSIVIDVVTSSTPYERSRSLRSCINVTAGVVLVGVFVVVGFVVIIVAPFQFFFHLTVVCFFFLSFFLSLVLSSTSIAFVVLACQTYECVMCFLLHTSIQIQVVSAIPLYKFGEYARNRSNINIFFFYFLLFIIYFYFFLIMFMHALCYLLIIT